VPKPLVDGVGLANGLGVKADEEILDERGHLSTERVRPIVRGTGARLLLPGDDRRPRLLRAGHPRLP